MSELALGCWAFAGNAGFWSDQERGDSLKTIHLALRSGIRAFDTASAYGNGRSEQMLGTQLKRFPLRREECFISTKTMGNDSLSVSLHRLCMDYVDLWYLHWPSTKKDCRSILSRMGKEKRARHIGISNATVSFLRTLEDIPLFMVQIPCTLLWTRGLEECVAYCRERGILLSGYSPTGMGTLSGFHDRPPDDSRAKLYCYRHGKEFSALLSALREVARVHGTSMSVIAIAWALRQGFDQICLGARTKEQLREDLTAREVVLTAQEAGELDRKARKLVSCAESGQDNLFGHRW